MKMRAIHNFYPGFPHKAEEFEVKDSSTVLDFMTMLSEKYEYDFIGNKIPIRFFHSDSRTETIEKLETTLNELTPDGTGKFYIWITPNKFEATSKKETSS